MRRTVRRALRRLAGAATLLLLAAAAPAAAGEDERQPVDLRAAERKVFSQFGEDGVIEKIFEIIEPTSRYCIEFGAHDGITHSNVRNLIVNHGWRGLQIEGDEKKAAKLAENYAQHPEVTTRQAWVWPGNVEILFEDAGVPRDVDLLVIDIDSNDYYVWRAIHDFRPKVVLIEGNWFFPPPQQMVIEYHPMNYWDGSHYLGASPQSMYNLARKKGYELVHHMTYGPNLFFVDAKYFDRFGIEDNSPAALMSPKLREVIETQGVKPKLGKPELVWKELRIEKKLRHDR